MIVIIVFAYYLLDGFYMKSCLDGNSPKKSDAPVKPIALK